MIVRKFGKQIIKRWHNVALIHYKGKICIFFIIFQNVKSIGIFLKNTEDYSPS